MQRFEHGGDIYDKPAVQLDFSANINPRGLPAGVKAAISRDVDAFARYPDPHCRALRAALASHHGLEQNQVLCGNGAADLIFRICACLRPRLALVTAPTFSEYEQAVMVHGGQVRFHLLKEQKQFDLDTGILEAITPDIDLVFLCSPNNPTGRLIAPELLQQVAQRCQQTGAYLVLDECFIDFTEGPSMVQQLQQYPRLLILRAFTKVYAMAGLRLGYLLAADEALLQRIAAFGAPWSVSGPAQAAGLAALEEKGWAADTRELLKQEQSFMAARLEQLGLKVLPSAANYLLIKAPFPLQPPLLQKGILVRDCGNYTGLDSCYIRIGLQMRENNLLLLRAIQEVLATSAASIKQ